MEKKIIIFLQVVLVFLLVANCAPQAKNTAPEIKPFFEKREMLFQLSTYQSLAAGNYAGFETVGDLKQNGDLGIGTFDGLNGEMIVLDGHIYQALADGQVIETESNVKIPFASVTWFDADITRNIKNIRTYADLQSELDALRPENENFYAVRIDGTFSALKIRTVPKQVEPYLPLAEAIKNQLVTEKTNVKGVALGFWSPEYVGGILVPGYHLHFISDDRKLAGHILDCALADGTAVLDQTAALQLILNPAVK
jgi:acetolactate decarboxylase